MKMKKIAALLIVIALLVTAVACGGPSGGEPTDSGSSGGEASGGETSGSKLDSIQSAGRLVVYTDPNFPPFEFIGPNQTPIGVDMEIARAIAEELGVALDIQEATFDSIITAIRSGRGDIAISGFTITEERAQSIDFSQPYIQSVQFLILLEDDDSITTMESLAGRSVGVAKGYSGQFWIEDEIDEGGVLYDTGVTVMEYNSAIDATLDLRAGRIDVVVMDQFVAQNIVANSTGLRTIPLQYADGELASEEYGVIVAKGNEDLLEVINSVLDRLIAEGKIEQWVIEFSE